MLAQVTLTIDPRLVVVDLLVAAFASFWVYRASQRYRQRFGVTPWNWPAGLWSFIVFLSVLIGLLLFVLARATTRPRLPRSEPEPGFGPVARGGGVDSGDLGTHTPPPALLPPAGWYPDPSGRHEKRYWDGKGWSGHVSTGGVRSEEPPPPR